MALAELVQGATWQLEVCNACRYCEGYCAVFPALERRRRFSRGDVVYLANLCFDCRSCYFACMYAPPHEFGVNLPQLFSEVRRETYAQYGWKRVAGALLGHNARFLAMVAVLSIAFFLAVTALTGDPARVVASHTGPGAFYAVIPYELMFVPAMAVSIAAFALLLAGGLRFARDTHGRLGDFLSLGAVAKAGADALGLRYLRGGGAGGCTYPSERPSFARYVLHHLVFYGFVAAFVSTSVAFVYQDVFGWLPPFPLLSVPVVLGSAGGIAMIVGVLGLIVLKRRSEPAPSDPRHVALEYVFLWLLLVVNVTGMLLLALRSTPAMGSLLILHLASVFALYVAIPHSKFAHFVYRYVALVQNGIETRRERDR